MNNGGLNGVFTATGGGIQSGITGTEICYRAVQTEALRLHGGTFTGRPETEAKGIRLQHWKVYVWPNHSGYPGAAGKGELHFCGSLMSQNVTVLGSAANRAPHEIRKCPEWMCRIYLYRVVARRPFFRYPRGREVSLKACPLILHQHARPGVLNGAGRPPHHDT